MKKFIKSSLLAFTLITAVVMDGCDAFESFVFGLPVSVTITTTGSTNPSGSASFCLDTIQTYQDYADKLNSIVFVEAYFVTLSISSGDENLQGDGVLRLFAGNAPVGTPLFVHTKNDIKPADYLSPNFYKIELTPEEIAAINAALKNNNSKCFYGDYEIIVEPGSAVSPYTIEVKIDMLYNIDANL